MPRHEILVDLALTEEQHLEIDSYELTRILRTLEDEYERFSSSLERRTRVPDGAEVFGRIRQVITAGHSVETVVGEILTLRNSIRDELEDVPVFSASLDLRRRTIMRLFDMLDSRIRQVRAPSRTTTTWIDQDLFAFEHSFELYFEVMSATGESPYRVRFTESPDRDDTYRIILSLAAQNDETMRVPVRLYDIMIDLAENARKFSRPGSRVDISIVEKPDHLELSVRDEGIGIPEKEITRVVGYGSRGSNAGEVPSGGGLGLTKAYSLIRRWGGRMWIESSPAGTTIEAEVPKPAP